MSLTPTDIISKISTKIYEIKDTYTIKGELHNYSKRNQNIFAAIKDKTSSIDIILWNSSEDYNNGDEVEIIGKINFFKKTSKINIQVITIKKLGIGNEFKIYEKLKLEFKELGYFDRKKLLPSTINSIGIVTSKDGAALQDVLYVLKNGGYNGNIIIKDCLVQGVNAPNSIKEAIHSFNEDSNIVDILLITRGGGSLEDLMSFSSKEVVKAIYDCNIFTISAVGHEVDSMLSDFVADLRAPTPSIGAQIILNEYKKKFLIYKDAEQVLSKILFELKSRINIVKKQFPKKEDLIDNIIKSRLKVIYDEIRIRFKMLKNNFEKIKNKIINNDITIINPETGNKVKDIDELYNEFIIIFNGKQLLYNPKNIIQIKE
jgi:exodeoxyribonuclease VII large subunit